MITIVQPPEDRGKLSLANGTRFVMPNGAEISDVTRCVVKWEVDCVVVAEMTLNLGQIQDIEAHPLLSMESLREAANHYGLLLVTRESLEGKA
ncbi:MAG TPA: hypothetical protein VLH12_08395 [Usitatibacter sp.]|nr:hypothetical protein [Usitatibacter sp.]